MSAIRMMAVFARRVGMTPQAFHDHWRYPHGSLGQGIRIIKRYVQSHQVDVDFLDRSEEHTSELQSLMRISYAVFCLKKKKTLTQYIITPSNNTTYNPTHNNTTQHYT